MAQSNDLNAGLLKKNSRRKQSKGQSRHCNPKSKQNREQNWTKQRIRVKQMKQGENQNHNTKSSIMEWKAKSKHSHGIFESPSCLKCMCDNEQINRIKRSPEIVS